MSDETTPLLTANVLLAMLVLIPVGIVVAAAFAQAVRRFRHRAVTWVDLPGVGRIPVLKE